MTDRIAEAARATRKYWPAPDWEYPDAYFAATEGYDPENVGEIYYSYQEAQAACDRLNLLAVLEAIREPSEGMLRAGYDSFEDGYVALQPRWRAMVDKLTAEVLK